MPEGKQALPLCPWAKDRGAWIPEGCEVAGRRGQPGERAAWVLLPRGHVCSSVTAASLRRLHTMGFWGRWSCGDGERPGVQRESAQGMFRQHHEVT